MRYLFTFITGLLLSLISPAQNLAVGSATPITILSGVTFSVDSLVFVPSATMTISNNVLTHTYTPIPGVAGGTNSIGRVYNFTAPQAFTGQIGIIYSDAELAGNTESLLQIAFRSGTTWTTTTGSAVNTVANYITYPAPGVVFGSTTATTTGVVLPIIFGGFTASLEDAQVILTWDMQDIENLLGFDIEFSNDGRNWTKAERVNAVPLQTEFTYTHADANFTTRHYRLAAISSSGQRLYSRSTTVRNGEAGTDMTVLRLGSGQAILSFSGQAPASLQVFDMRGQLLMTRTVNQQQVRLQGLTPGIYAVRFVVDGKKVVKRMQL